ncbi:PTS sugar transporter subunit IIB [Schnuerera sp. xch1]|uniref:PTS sugar transporter subunit IIB n=1 Tax=Schnuerera sp. xch1 TaxID=2874283 RepID=UPI001CBF6053|nr:PTS sugar transporter subunit IIB [Schnuerera sp. xch1]MBZ2174899.1 PTS sugar transporter subunit IIB [Schnuerera sp. xch1]
MIKVLMVCSGGMSSSLVVNTIKKEAEKENIEIDIKAVGTGEYIDEVKEDWDLILVAPQVRHRFEGFEEQAKEENIPIELIPPQNYNPLAGAKLIKQIKKYL